MALCRVSIVTLALLLMESHVKGVERVTVDAAMRYLGDFTILIAGNGVLLLMHDAELELDTISSFGIPENFHLLAASVPDGKRHMHYYGSDFYYDFDYETSNTTRVNYDRRARNKFFRNGGPDAVAMKDGKEFFFKGCKMAERDRWARKINVKKFGLPCVPDAAWTSGDGNDIVVLKGDQIWVWDGENKAEEPKDFSSMYNITSWELIPSNSKE